MTGSQLEDKSLGMNLTQTLVQYGLNSKVATTRSASSGNVEVGMPLKFLELPDTNQIYGVQFLLANASADAALDLPTGDASTTTPWTAPVQQVETATAAGTILLSGTAKVTVTSAVLAGSPLDIYFSVVGGDTPALWAVKCRTALAANEDVAALFAIGGVDEYITLTRLPEAVYTMGAETVNLAHANDATLNVALANGLCTGITAAPTSANTTTAVVAVGTYMKNDSVDFEGLALDPPVTVDALMLTQTTEDTSCLGEYIIGATYSGRLLSSPEKESAALFVRPDTDGSSLIGFTTSTHCLLSIVAANTVA